MAKVVYSFLKVQSCGLGGRSFGLIAEPRKLYVLYPYNLCEEERRSNLSADTHILVFEFEK